MINLASTTTGYNNQMITCVEHLENRKRLFGTTLIDWTSQQASCTRTVILLTEPSKKLLNLNYYGKLKHQNSEKSKYMCTLKSQISSSKDQICQSETKAARYLLKLVKCAGLERDPARNGIHCNGTTSARDLLGRGSTRQWGGRDWVGVAVQSPDAIETARVRWRSSKREEVKWAARHTHGISRPRASPSNASSEVGWGLWRKSLGEEPPGAIAVCEKKLRGDETER